MLRKGATLVLLLICAVASAQRSVQLTLPDGDFTVFSSNGPASGPPSDAQASKGGTATVSLKSGDDHLYVWDKTTDDLAVKSGKDLKDSWSVKSGDFSRLESLTAKVMQGTVPLASGEISIRDGDSRHSQIVDASGPAVFFDVKPGEIAISVRYKGASGETKDSKQVFTVDLHSSKDARVLTVPVEASAAPAPTTQASPPTVPSGSTAGAGSTEAPRQVKEKANPIGVFFGWILALAVAIGVILGVLYYMRNNPAAVSARLEQLGVQVPKPGDQGLSSATPIAPDPIRPQPVQKIVLPDAAVDPMPAAAPSFSAQPTAVAVSEPSLVSDSGIPIPLAEGDTVVGREPGLGLSLSAETTVSRRHATLTRMGNEVTLTDHGSTNGTFVNGARLSAPVVLRLGDSVQFGSARFVYRA